MTPAASRPARALRGGVVVLTVAVACRVPAIEREFRAALAPGGAVDRGGEHPAAPLQLAAATAPGGAAPTAPVGVTGSIKAPGETASAPPVAEYGAELLVRRRSPTRQGQDPDAATPAVETTDTAEAPRLAALPRSDAPTLDAATPDAVTPNLTASPGTLAAAAFARLAAGDRRGAVRLFDAALAGDDPRAATWRRQRDLLTRRWSASAYSIVRAGGDPALAARPLLGGGQSGAQVAFTPDPLAPRPLALTLRGSAAHDDAGRSGIVAVGAQWRPFAGVTLAGERLIAVGAAAREAWTARLAAGGERRIGRVRLTGYGEGGIIGAAPYAAVQARAAAVVDLRHVAVEPGVGSWASLQHDRATVDRVDLGPGVVARAGHFAVKADWRFRVAGNAAPASGPVLTLSAAF